jgi:hypothetical protein
VARTKLDRVYLEALVSAQRNPSQQRASPEEVRGLQEEVESLYAEILPVAQMSVEQQYLEPALKAVAERNGNTLGRSAEAAAYVSLRLHPARHPAHPPRSTLVSTTSSIT